MAFRRSSGVLLHPTSLAGRFGIGDLGPGAFEFIDLLEQAGLTKGNDMALAFAVRGCYTAVARRLLEAGAKTTAQIQGAPMVVLAARFSSPRGGSGESM